jgi:cytochrome c biogenesis protein CcmG, thiol:disulfide interchange protein DsbE
MNRQWMTVGIVVGLILALIGIGWIARDRFAPIEVGSEAPDYQTVDLKGNPVRVSDLRGEVVLLNIWATWCPPCREEMPSMQRLHEELGPQGLKIVAVSVDAAPGKVDRVGKLGGNIEEFAREMNLTFEIWHDESGEIQRKYWATAVPETFVINRAGLIVKKVIGGTQWDSEANRALFLRLLAE